MLMLLNTCADEGIKQGAGLLMKSKLNSHWSLVDSVFGLPPCEFCRLPFESLFHLSLYGLLILSISNGNGLLILSILSISFKSFSPFSLYQDTMVTIILIQVYGGSGSHGIAIFIKSSINAHVFYDVGPFHEQLWLSIPLVGNNSLPLGCVYRSPSSNISTSTCQLCRLLEHAASLLTHLLVCGDFNYPNIDWTTSCGRVSESNAQKFLDTLQDPTCNFTN